jgi:hypothetical protein
MIGGGVWKTFAVFPGVRYNIAFAPVKDAKDLYLRFDVRF